MLSGPFNNRTDFICTLFVLVFSLGSSVEKAMTNQMLVSLTIPFTSFAFPAILGVFVGLAAGVIANWLMVRLKDRFLEILVSFLAAFMTYLAAEGIGGSGVLAAVACGGLIGRAQIRLAARTRLESNSAWDLVEFILASLVFLLVGLQLRGILDRLPQNELLHLLVLGAAISATLIVSRFVWVFLTFYPATALVAVFRGGRFTPGLSHPTIIAWAGMRGVVSLAAALALPSAFAGRDIIVFLAFCAIFSTLVLQGTTLKILIGWFDLTEPEIGTANPATVAARRAVAAAIAGVTPVGANNALAKVSSLSHAVTDVDDLVLDREKLDALLDRKIAAIQVARDELKKRRDEIDGETLMTLTQELDLEEEQIRLAMDGATETPL